MASYKYVASELNGKTVKGVMNAPNEIQLKTNLQNKGLYLVSFEEDDKTKNGPSLKDKDLSEFCRELGSLLRAGVTVVKALSIISKRNVNPRLRKVYNDINAEIRRGTALSDAMAMQGRSFPQLLVNMIRAGEASGKLDESCANMALYYSKSSKLAQEVKSAMTYPMVLLVLTVVVIIAMFTFILPSFLGLFEGMELPAITQVMIGISNLFTQHWAVLILFAAIVGIVGYILWHTEAVRFNFDKIKIKMPKIGRLMKIICTARFARTLSSLYSSGLTILTALNISKTTVGNRYIESQFDEAIKLVRSGNSLSEALNAVDGFDIKLIQTIAIGEETGSLDELLINVADDFEYESGVAMKKLVTMLEPLMICVMACVVLLVIMSVMLPIYTLYGEIDSSAPEMAKAVVDTAKNLKGMFL